MQASLIGAKIASLILDDLQLHARVVLIIIELEVLQVVPLCEV